MATKLSARLLPVKPTMPPEMWAELELHGVDSMRGLLASSTDGYSGTGRMTDVRLGGMVAKRGQIQDWLKWKAACIDLWLKAGVVMAFVAAVLAGLSWLAPLK